MHKSTSKQTIALAQAHGASAHKVPIAALVAGALGASGFSLAIVAGLLSENDASSIFFRATVALVACALAGYAVGLIFEWLVRMESARLEKAATEIIQAESPKIGLAESEVESENVQASSQRRESVGVSSRKSGR